MMGAVSAYAQDAAAPETMDDEISSTQTGDTLTFSAAHKACTSDGYVVTLSTSISGSAGGQTIQQAQLDVGVAVYKETIAVALGAPLDAAMAVRTGEEVQKFAAGIKEGFEPSGEDFALSGAMSQQLMALIAKGVSAHFDFKTTVSEAPSPLCP